MALLTGFGFWHLRRVSPAEELMSERLHLPAQPVAV
jgi:hypothetical protein